MLPLAGRNREVDNEDDRKKHEKDLMEKASAAASIKEELDGEGEEEGEKED